MAQLNPYTQAGSAALAQQQNILGLNGANAQGDAYAQIQGSPAFQAMGKAGQDAILAQASATGGVRGGNTQGALAQFGTQNLANLMQQQYSQLGGLSNMGYGAAGAQGNMLYNAGVTQGGYQQDLGAIKAGSILGQQQAYSDASPWNLFGQGLGLVAGSGWNPFGGGKTQ